MSTAPIMLKRMTTMMIKRTLLFVVLATVCVSGFPQKDNFGIWYDISTEIKPIKKFELDLEACLRTFDNASRIEETFVEAGLSYKLNKYISAGAAYRFTENIEDDDSYHPRHKWFIDLKGSVPSGDFSFIARIRYQTRYKTYYEDEDDKIPDSHIRGKFTIFYDIPSFHLNPYLGYELFTPVFNEPKRRIDKNRFFLGAEYNLTKKHTVEAEYIFQRDYLPRLRDLNILSLQYKFKL